MKKCCFTGHRHFPWEESKDDSKLRTIMDSLEQAIDEAIRKGAAHFICGNAVGVDTGGPAGAKEERTEPRHRA